MELYKYILGGALCLGSLFSSCSDWLEVEPVDTRTTNYYYKTPKEMEQALMGIYNGLLPVSEYSLLMSELRSDNVWCGEYTGAQRDYLAISTYDPNLAITSTISGAWEELYRIVYRTNVFLSKVDGVTFIIEGTKEQMIGEARFLRALAYFDLVRYFGRIPLTLSPLTITEAMSVPQSEAHEIYEKAIIPDLEYAITSLNDAPTDYLGKATSTGRATLQAAQSLLGKVYLTMAGYPLYDESKKELAKDLFEKVIDYADAKKKFWAKNADEWKRIWISDNDNKYHIFEIQYIAAKDYGNPMAGICTPKLPSQYTAVQLAGWSMGCADGLEELQGEEKDAEEQYLDVRCLATIDTTKFVNKDNPNQITRYSGDDFFIKFMEHKIKRQELGYSDIDGQIIDRTYFPINYPLIRLEDVMLMYAEIVGPTDRGIDMVDRIRTRAGLSELSDAEKVPDKFQKCIEKERRKELAFEGIRWHDLVRHNNLQAVKDKFMHYATDSEGNITRPLVAQYADRVKEGTYLYPIPDTQMKVKEGLYEQNEAYK